MQLLPNPKYMAAVEGVFKFHSDTQIVLDASCPVNALDYALMLQNEIFHTAGFKAAVTKAFAQRMDVFSIVLKIGAGKPEEYTISMSAEMIRITGADSAGLFYGVQTLKQMIRLEGVSLPCFNISDFPDYQFRGFMYDITRGKVPTLNTLKELVDRISFYKLNQLHLYIEHSFAFKKHTEVWMGQDPLSAEEILLLDAYCKKRNVELVPCIATFGHLYQVLRSESFKELSELPEDNTPYSWIDRQHHHTLDVSNPKSIEFVQDMIDEFVPLFSSNKFNIGCDETFDLGEGKNKALAEKVGKGRLYIDFLKKIIAHVEKYGKQVLFWGDIILTHSEYLPELPKGVAALNWNYSADAAEDDTSTFARHDVPQYVCPGINSWDKLISDIEGSYRNISKMAGYGKKYKALGMLNTDWGDHGHIHPFSVSMPGMILGAVFSWNTEEKRALGELNQLISKVEFRDTSGRIMDLLHRVSREAPVTWLEIDIWYEKLSGHTWGQKHLKDSVEKWTDEKLFNAYLLSLTAADDIAGLYRKIPEERKLDLREFYISVRGIALFQALGVFIRSTEKKENPEKVLLPRNQLAEAFEGWYEEYAEIWRQRSKESELYRIRDFVSGICKVLRRG